MGFVYDVARQIGFDGQGGICCWDPFAVPLSTSTDFRASLWPRMDLHFPTR